MSKVMTCPRCKNIWEYKGKNEWYAPCSKCKTSIPVKTGVEVKQNVA